ncbi:SpoIIE family protein phosphatase [Streptomyces sp. NPDC059489]|uniref:SpoIIE family protein phosphatase n=1 Tax=Streptomyces sp. NPDC059489 TaxID=3346849 RepID=UPI00368FEB92
MYEAALLDALLHEAPVAISIYDEHLRFVLQNDQLRRMSGLSDAERREGLTLSDLMPGPEGGGIRRRQRDVLKMGLPRTDEVRGATRSEPNREHVWAESLFPLRNEEREPFAVGHVILDVTERVRSRERLILAGELGSRIGTSLDVTATARELAEAVVPDLADAAAVFLREAVMAGEDVSPDSEAEVPSLKIAARYGSSSDAAGAPLSRLEAAAAARKATLERPAETRTGSNGTSDARIVVPMFAQGKLLGVLVLTRGPGKTFEEDDLLLAEEVAARAAVSVENARRYTHERRTALELQRSLLPEPAHVPSAVDVATRYLPAASSGLLGGDWAEFIPMSGARVALIVGEAAGHDLQAAVTMGRLRTAVRTLAALDFEPEELLARLNDQAARSFGPASRSCHEDVGEMAEISGNTEAHRTDQQGSTCLCAVYDPISRVCALASAGQPPPILVTPDGSADPVEMEQGLPLGESRLPFEPTELELPEGSSLVLCSKDLADPRQHGETDAATEPVLDALTRAGTSPEALCESAARFLNPQGTVLPHGVAVLVAQTHVLGPGQFVTADLSGEAAEVSDVRSFVEHQLSDWQLEDLAFTTQLVATELVTNAIRYGAPPFRMRLIKDESLICEVSDSSSTAPHLRHAEMGDEGGRGLLLVAQFSRDWGTRYSRRGKTIWAEQPLEL